MPVKPVGQLNWLVCVAGTQVQVPVHALHELQVPLPEGPDGHVQSRVRVCVPLKPVGQLRVCVLVRGAHAQPFAVCVDVVLPDGHTRVYSVVYVPVYPLPQLRVRLHVAGVHEHDPWRQERYQVPPLPQRQYSRLFAPPVSGYGVE